MSSMFKRTVVNRKVGTFGDLLFMPTKESHPKPDRHLMRRHLPSCWSSSVGSKRNPQPGQFRQAVEWGIEAGYRHIDTASMYKNEVEVGEGIANKINQGLVTRKDLFITTKISPTLTQHKLVDYCKSVSVVPVAYTPLGLLSDARPEFIGKDTIKNDPRLDALANKYKKTKAQIALKYLVQRNIVVIPKSFTKSRIEENLNLFDFELNEQEMALVDSFNIDHSCQI
ncbi:unnamed protein product [Leptidea sinapis]|uniref:NADP-dependent oxidoreductase domain-containing protein n=1 Tax=Leptidea sinapis TaxID=189913 RepID=A0A5E4QFX2_9NEOP|nr:unnamed protein product [Leptidea sinapis]